MTAGDVETAALSALIERRYSWETPATDLQNPSVEMLMPFCSELRRLGDPFALAVESVVRKGRVQRGDAYPIGAAAYESTNVFHA